VAPFQNHSVGAERDPDLAEEFAFGDAGVCELLLPVLEVELAALGSTAAVARSE
jgi:hypothetical protein